MEAFTKTVYPGITSEGSIKAEIKFNGRRLSISGTHGRFAAGQIDMHEWPINVYGYGWTPELVSKFREVWGRWHLNDMRAGNPEQEEYLRAHPEFKTYPDRIDALAKAGLNSQYRYGSAWLYEEVPADVLNWLKELP